MNTRRLFREGTLQYVNQGRHLFCFTIPSLGEIQVKKSFLSALVTGLVLSSVASAADLTEGMKPGAAKLTSAGPIAFAPNGILLAADPKSATITAFATGDVSEATSRNYSVESVDEKIAASLGTKASEIQIVDIATNPASHTVYASVSRGRGPDATPVLLKIAADGKISEVDVSKVPSSMAAIPNAAESREGQRGNPRNDSITDLGYIDGQVLIAGLSNEEFSSNLRTIRFPFGDVSKGTSVEIFHGAHGKLETNSPVRTFAACEIGGQAHLLAAYTCTPLVKIPIADLKAGNKIRGTTVAELGNRNRPLDMVVYQRDGKNFVLLANSARGVMKITMDGIDAVKPIEARVADTAGLKYETLELKGVDQLDRLDEKHAVILQKSAEGAAKLVSIDLP
jgi:hypothetical protein